MQSGGRPDNHCPSCGAPIGDVERERCEYCGAAINAPAAAARVAARHMEKATRSAWRKSWIYVVGFTGISIVMALVAQRNAVNTAQRASQAAANARPAVQAARGPARQALQLQTLLATVSDGGGKLSLLFATSRSPEHPIVLLDAGTSAVRWQSGPYGNYVRKTQIALLGDKLCVAAESRLTALRLRDGAVLWQASLAADVMEYAEAVRAAGERVAVLERDGTTQVFEANTGKTVWAHKRTPPPHRLQGAGDLLVEFERAEKPRGRGDEIVVVDLATGEARHRLRPRCSSHSIMPVQTPNWTAPLLLDPDGQELYVTYGDFRFCVDRWDSRTGALAWQVNRPREGETVGTEHGKSPFLLGDELVLYAGADSAVYGLSRSKGELRKIVAEAEQVLTPAFVQGNLLVVTAVPSWEHRDCGDAKKCALWGVDLDKGAVLWRYALPADGRIGIHGLADRLVGRLDPTGLTLAMASGKDQLALDHLDRESGVVKSHKSIKLADELRHLELDRDLVWVEARGFTGIDAQTGAIRFRLE